MSCKAVYAKVLILVVSASSSANATQVTINGTTTFFDNYENATNVAAESIPTAQFDTPEGGYLPNAPQSGSWHSFQGTDTEASTPTTFVQNIQVTSNPFSDIDPLSPGPYSGDTYLRTFRNPSGGAFAQNPGTRIGYDGVNETANVGDTYHFETMVSAQLESTNLTTLTVFGLNDLSTFSGVDMIGIAFRSDGAILSRTANTPSTLIDTGLVWIQNTWDVLKIDYVDGADTFTLTYGTQDPVPLSLIKDVPGETGVIVGNKRVGLITFGNGAGGAASGNGAINGGAGSRLYYDSVGLDPAVILSGDFNLDGQVDAADYVLWRKNSDSFLPATYDTWRANFGNPPGSGAGLGAVAVPEPGAFLLLIAAVTASFTVRPPRSTQGKQ